MSMWKSSARVHENLEYIKKIHEFNRMSVQVHDSPVLQKYYYSPDSNYGRNKLQQTWGFHIFGHKRTFLPLHIAPELPVGGR